MYIIYIVINYVINKISELLISSLEEDKFSREETTIKVNGEDIIFVCRTALNNPNDYHNSNYQTFDIIKDFRNL